MDAQDTGRRTGHTAGAVLTLDGPMPDADQVSAAIGARLPLAVPLRHAVLPHPGGDEELFAFVAQAIRTPSDAGGWHGWAIDGLARDRWAVLLTVDPDIADSSAAVRLLTAATDGATGAVPLRAVGDSAPPGIVQDIVGSVVGASHGTWCGR